MTLALSAFSTIFLLSALSEANAQTINAASCNESDVQTAFNSITQASATINIPSGTCGWSNSVSVSIPSVNTSLSVLGAGNLTTQGGGDATVIQDNYANTGPLLTVTTGGKSTFFRLAGITIEGGSAGQAKDAGVVIINGNSTQVRVDHDHFNNDTYSPYESATHLYFGGCTAGVVDHSTFDNTDFISNGVKVLNQAGCNNDAVGMGDQSWTLPTAMGTPSSYIYIENNTFNDGFVNDCTGGGKFVVRFNTFNSGGGAIQDHGTGAAGRYRGCRAFEIYENTMNSTAYNNAGLYLDSGTGVIWGNTAINSGGNGFKQFAEVLVNRQTNGTYSQTSTPNGWGYCGTTFDGTGSNWDQNSNQSSGAQCLDQLGAGVGDLLVNDFPNVTNNATGATSSAAGAWPRQKTEPIYEWLDNWVGPTNNTNVFWANNSPTAITNNQNYYLGCSSSASGTSGCTSFNGTAGVGSGTLSARPSTCTTGVGYWATDQGGWNQSGSGGQGELFVCTATNTWTPYYTPYTYPHPLTQGAAATAPSAPAAPTNLQAVPH